VKRKQKNVKCWLQKPHGSDNLENLMYVLKFFCEFKKKTLRKATIGFSRPHVSANFREIWYWRLLPNSVNKTEVCLKIDDKK